MTKYFWPFWSMVILFSIYAIISGRSWLLLTSLILSFLFILVYSWNNIPRQSNNDDQVSWVIIMLIFFSLTFPPLIFLIAIWYYVYAVLRYLSNR